MFFNTSLQDLKEQRREKRIGRKSERLANAKRTKISKRINLRSIARYSMMPEILPRVRSLGMHFGHFAYMIALVLNSARLIPNGHPALHARSIGQFSVRNVLAIAANNIEWKWKNVDQIAIFSSVVIGMILILIQAVLIALYAFSGTAFAQGAAVGSTSFFETPAANVPTDVVLIFLDQVFGANLDMFGAAAQPTGTPVYEGLQAILGLYSMATMVIAVIIVLYYILTVIGEAAKTGTPFGQRFNSLWAPIRLVVALGLLVPLSSGLNSAQYLTLWTAKMGSGLATQVWTEFVSHMTSTSNIVSKPPHASTTGLVARTFLNEVCAASYNQIEETSRKQITILQALGNTSQAVNFASAQSMVDAAKNAGMNHVDISWSNRTAGENATDYTCGHIIVSLADFDFYAREGNDEIVSQDEGAMSYAWGWIWGGRALRDQIGTVNKNIRASYVREIGTIVTSVKTAAEAVAAYKISVNAKAGLGDRAALDAANIILTLQDAALTTHTNVNTEIVTTFESLTDSNFAKSDAFDEVVKRGWGAAGLWYGNIGKINQKYMDAVSAAAPTLGTIVNAPANNNPENTVQRNPLEQFFGVVRFGLTGDETVELEAAINLALTEFTNYILDVGNLEPDNPLYQEAKISNASADWTGWFAEKLIWMLGGSELYNLKDNPSLDPMARLMGAGHAMVGRSMGAFGIGVGLSAAGIAGSAGASIPIVGGVSKGVGEVAGAVAGIFFVFAGIGLVAGVFLAFIIPILPFVYFSFAIIGWVLEIFEAVVAMPMWALAHLRIDGDGMPGQAAMGGYHLLLMILLRPTLIVFGLIGGYIIFGAAVFFFSSLFNSATSILQQEISGNSVNAIGVFVYTIIFTFLTYNIALMCFKMIDDVPKGMLRWLGANVQPFSDSKGDPIGGAREMVIGTVAGAGAIGSGIGRTSSGLQKASERQKMRKAGGDPDNPIARTEIVSSPKGSPEGGD